MAELADALDLGSSPQGSGFKSLLAHSIMVLGLPIDEFRGGYGKSRLHPNYTTRRAKVGTFSGHSNSHLNPISISKIQNSFYVQDIVNRFVIVELSVDNC